MANKKKQSRPGRVQLTVAQKEKLLLQNNIILGAVLSIFATYICLAIGAYMFDNSTTPSATKDVGVIVTGIIHSIQANPLFVFPLAPSGILYSALAIFVILMLMVIKYEMERRRVRSDPYSLKGTAEWLDPQTFSAQFAQQDDKKTIADSFFNAICSQNAYMSLDHHKHFTCLNTLVMGQPGSGKSRYVLKPNLLQMNANYIITDPSGGLTESCAETLRRFGYNVRVFDIDNKTGCNTYNPLKYCYNEADIMKIATSFLTSTEEAGAQKGEQFWTDNAKKAMCCFIDLLKHYGQNAEIMGGKCYSTCFANLCEMTRLAGTPSPHATPQDRQNGGARAMELHQIFKRIEASLQPGEPKPFCLREWEDLTAHPDKTYGSVLSTISSKLEPFNFKEIKDLTSTDNICLDEFGTGRDAIFLIIPTTDKTYNCLAAFLYTQMFDLLYKQGRNTLGAKMLKLPDGELVKFFTKEECEAGITERVADIKKAHYKKVVVQEPIKINPKKKKKNKAKVSYIYDEYYEIYSNSDVLISRRPTEALAKQYIEDLQEAYLLNGNGEALPAHCRFLLDEAANIGNIPNFLEILSTVRKYEISVMPIFQSFTQAKNMYKEAAETLDQDCPITIHLGGAEPTTNKYVAEKIGNATVRGMGFSDGGKQNSTSTNIDGRSLIMADEIGRMDPSEQLILVTGQQPMRDKKFDYEAHKNYKYTYDYAHSLGVEAYKFMRDFPQIDTIPIVRDAAPIFPNIEECTHDNILKHLSAQEVEDFMEGPFGSLLGSSEY